jgi:HK97 family phage major capsid protein
MRVKELREKRVTLVNQARALNDRALAESRDFSAEESTQWERYNADIDRLGREIARTEKLTELEGLQEQRANNHDRRELRRPGDTRARKNTRDERHPDRRERINALAVQGWCRAQLGLNFTPKHEQAAKLAGVKLRSKNMTLGLARNARQIKAEYRNAMSLTVGSGGYTVPQGFSGALERAMLMFGPMLDVADIVRTDSGNDLPWPTANDTGNSGVLLTEGTTIGSSVDPSFGSKTLKAYKFSSQLVLVSAELLMDSAFQLVQILGEMLGERLGRVQNTYFTTGTGSSQPSGIVTGSSAGVTAAGASAIAMDDVIGLAYSVDRAYRTQSSFLAHDNIYLAIRKLKDTTNQYLWQPSVQAGQPDRLLNFPALTNNDMTGTIATTNKTMLFGMLSKYKVRQVSQIRLRHLVERYADTDQEGFVGFMRADGVLLDAGVAPVKRLTQA